MLSRLHRHGQLSHKNRDDLRGAARQLPRRLPQGAAPRPGRALLRRSTATATGYVTVEPQLAVDADRAPDHRGPLAGGAAAGAAVGGAVRVRRRAGRRQPRHHRVRRPAQAAARGLQVPAHHGRATARVAATATLFLDLVFIGSSNEIHLSAFKEIPEFQSFKGRIELVRVPYLLDFRHEQQHLRGEAARGGGTRARRAAQRLRGGAVGGADPHAQAAWPRSIPKTLAELVAQADAAREGGAVRAGQGARRR